MEEQDRNPFDIFLERYKFLTSQDIENLREAMKPIAEAYENFQQACIVVLQPIWEQLAKELESQMLDRELQLYREAQYIYFDFADEKTPLRPPLRIDPTIRSNIPSRKRLDKLYTPGRRVRGDVAI